MAAFSHGLSSAWHYDFVRLGFWGGTLCAALAAVVGYFVLLRRMAFAAHALGHVGFAGACAGVLLHGGALPGMLVLNIAAAAGMGWWDERVQKGDLVVGMLLSFALGLGTLFLAWFRGYAGEANVILFGNILALSRAELAAMAGLTVASFAALLVFFRPLLFSSLEPELAEARGVPLRLVSLAFYILVGVAVAVASQMIGVLLVFALLIGPPAAAQRLSRQVARGIFCSVAIGIGVTWASLVLAYVSDAPVSFWVPAILLPLYLLAAWLDRARGT